MSGYVHRDTVILVSRRNARRAQQEPGARQVSTGMVDRIADLWGARTPFARGGEWPVRVDTMLAAGITEQDVDRWVPTASILHSNGDALDIADGC